MKKAILIGKWGFKKLVYIPEVLPRIRYPIPFTIPPTRQPKWIEKWDNKYLSEEPWEYVEFVLSHQVIWKGEYIPVYFQEGWKPSYLIFLGEWFFEK